MEENIENNVVENSNVENNVEEVKKEKTYTEEDIQNSFNAGVRKASTGWQKDAQYKEFLEWKKNTETNNNRIAELEQENQNLTRQITSMYTSQKLEQANVQNQFKKFVANEITDLMQENEKLNFDEALKLYKNDNPQYFTEKVVKKVQTSPNLNNGNKATTTNDIMNSLLRNR